MTLSSRAIEIGVRAIDQAQLQWKAENGGDAVSCIDCPTEVIAKAFLVALAAEGMVLVPREPDEAMAIAGVATLPDYEPDCDSARSFYRAMLSAHQADEDSEGKK